jgi:hypothetical protein
MAAERERFWLWGDPKWRFDAARAPRASDARARAALERRRCGDVLRSKAQTRSRTSAPQLTIT